MQVSVNSKAERLKIYKTQAFGGMVIIFLVLYYKKQEKKLKSPKKPNIFFLKLRASEAGVSRSLPGSCTKEPALHAECSS